MAHPEQMEFVGRVSTMFPDAFVGKRVLEIGSLDINGSIRGLFRQCDYIGLDVAAGPGVDVVCQGQDYDAPEASFDTVVCCEVMEHNPSWKETFANMLRLCKPGGLVLMTCASTGRQEHGTTRTTPVNSPLTISIGWEYYRNLVKSDFCKSFNLHESLSEFCFFQNWKSFDLYFVGFRKGADLAPETRRKLAATRRHYLCESARVALKQLKMRLLIAAVGEERYWAGPVRFWRE
ncbi:MAG: methyltransferase domain-containing protein [Rhodopila sp.]|nr:methyltransferase domain-containing protein [Rhodopila sp.]